MILIDGKIIVSKIILQCLVYIKKYELKSTENNTMDILNTFLRME